MQIGKTRLLKVENVHLKLEYENPSGSVKDRAVSKQMLSAIENGLTEFVISSSGNAAISACFYAKEWKIKPVHVYLPKSVNGAKLGEIRELGGVVHVTGRPNSEAFKFAKHNKAFNIRGSLDPVAWDGYSRIAEELEAELPTVGSVFAPVSSGALLWGMATGFSKVEPAIFAVQTPKCAYLAKNFIAGYTPSSVSLADALIATHSSLERKLAKIIRTSGGNAFIESDEEIENGSKWLENRGIICSYEGGAVIAAYLTALESGLSLPEPVVCILTGKKYQDRN